MDDLVLDLKEYLSILQDNSIPAGKGTLIIYADDLAYIVETVKQLGKV